MQLRVKPLNNLFFWSFIFFFSSSSHGESFEELGKRLGAQANRSGVSQVIKSNEFDSLTRTAQGLRNANDQTSAMRGIIAFAQITGGHHRDLGGVIAYIKLPEPHDLGFEFLNVYLEALRQFVPKMGVIDKSWAIRGVDDVLDALEASTLMQLNSTQDRAPLVKREFIRFKRLFWLKYGVPVGCLLLLDRGLTAIVPDSWK